MADKNKEKVNNKKDKKTAKRKCEICNKELGVNENILCINCYNNLYGNRF